MTLTLNGRLTTGLPVDPGQAGAGEVPGIDPGHDKRGEHPVDPVAFPAVGAALTIAWVCSVLMSWQINEPMTRAANRSHSRR
jgi:hypothetical protein